MSTKQVLKTFLLLMVMACVSMQLFSQETANSFTNVRQMLDEHNHGQTTNLRIVGGEDANIEDYPWQVAIQEVREDGNRHNCGGSVISEEYVITAAHCVFYDDKEYVVVAGTTSIGNAEEQHIYEIAEIRKHIDYDIQERGDDIAVLKMANRFDFDHPGIDAISLMNEADVAMGLEKPGIMGEISGWGVMVWEYGPSPDTLQVAQVPIVDVFDTNFGADDLDGGMILAGTDSTSGCKGDSGGPLMVPDGIGGVKLAGATSWGVGCALAGYPGVWTRLSYYQDWVAENVDFKPSNRFNSVKMQGFEPANIDGQLPENWQVKRNFSEDGGLSGENLQPASENLWYRNSHLFGPDNARKYVRTGEASLLIEAGAPGFTWAISPDVELSTQDSSPELAFQVWHDTPNNNELESSFHVNVFSNQQWHTIFSLDPETTNFYQEEIILDLSAFEGETIKLAFVYEDNGSSPIALDDISIRTKNPLQAVDFVVSDHEGPIDEALIQVDRQGVLTTGADGRVDTLLYDGDFHVMVYKNGFYPVYDTITIEQSLQTVEIAMEKIPAPGIVVNPDSFELQAEQGESIEESLHITNPGELQLDFSFSAYPAGGESQKESHGETVGEDVVIHYDQGPFYTATTVGASDRISAVRFTNQELEEYYNNHQLSAIRFQIMAMEFEKINIKVWIGGSDDGPGTLVYSKNVTEDVNPGMWNMHKLTEKIDLIEGEEYWIGYSLEAQSGTTIGFDPGPGVPGKGNWYYYNDEWILLSDLGLDYNWCIRGYFTPMEGLDWISYGMDSGEVEAGEDTFVDITFDAKHKDPGFYEAYLLINNNSGEKPYIPVNFQVSQSLHDVEFVVVDEAGNEISDAALLLDGQLNEPGSYSVEDLWPGVYEYNVSRDGYVTGYGEIEVESDDLTVTVTLISEQAEQVMLAINIEDTHGSPVTGASVQLDLFGNHVSGDDGQVFLPVVAGEQWVEIKAEGMQAHSQEFVIEDNMDDFQLYITLEYHQYLISADVCGQEGGSVSGAGSYSFAEQALLTAAPAHGYYFLYWKEDGRLISAEHELSFEVKEDRNIQACFKKDVYSIQIVSSPNGNIAPTGNVLGIEWVEFGSSIEFSFEPHEGYYIDDVLLDGQSHGPEESLMLENIDQDHTLEVVFSIHTFTIFVTVGENGSIIPYSGSLDPDGNMTVDFGSQQSFFIEPDSGYEIYELLADGEPVETFGAYTFTNITTDHSLEAVFQSATSTNTVHSQEQIRVFPNPASDYIYVNAQHPIDELHFVNAFGQNVKTVNSPPGELKLYLYDIPPGIYLIKAIAGNQKVIKKVSVQ